MTCSTSQYSAISNSVLRLFSLSLTGRMPNISTGRPIEIFDGNQGQKMMPHQGWRALIVRQTCRDPHSAVSNFCDHILVLTLLEASFRIYKICALLHRSKLRMSRSKLYFAKFRRNFRICATCCYRYTEICNFRQDVNRHISEHSAKNDEIWQKAILGRGPILPNLPERNYGSRTDIWDLLVGIVTLKNTL